MNIGDFHLRIIPDDQRQDNMGFYGEIYLIEDTVTYGYDEQCVLQVLYAETEYLLQKEFEKYVT